MWGCESQGSSWLVGETGQAEQESFPFSHIPCRKRWGVSRLREVKQSYLKCSSAVACLNLCSPCLALHTGCCQEGCEEKQNTQRKKKVKMIRELQGQTLPDSPLIHQFISPESDKISPDLFQRKSKGD